MCMEILGASHYGVADLELLSKETHKFESRYLDNLIGEVYCAFSLSIHYATFSVPLFS